jgi:copper(I)-binding protein
MLLTRVSNRPILIACLLLSACGGTSKAPLVISDIVITAPMPGRQMSAGYLSLTNNTDEAIRISRVVSPQFETVEIHESLLEDGVAKMRRIAELSIPPNSTVSLARGGKHLMLMRPNGNIDVVTLNFYSGDAMLLGMAAPLSTRNQ